MKPAMPTPNDLIGELLKRGWTHAGEDGDGNWRTWFFRKGNCRASLDEPCHMSPRNVQLAYASNARRFQIALANS